tara:strand:- start:202 stop:846 length:645 start_codon:yes stop_codon:yes gene_type:complete
MSTITDTLNDETLFIPGDDTATDKPKFIPKAEGEYLGHIVSARTTTREWTDKTSGQNFKACIYNFKVRVAPENKEKSFTYSRNGVKHTTDGEPYVGWEVVSKGIFRFLEPDTTKGDTFVSNATANDRYMRFCQALKIDATTSEREVDGKTVNVQVMPTLTEKDIEGLPVTAIVGREKEDWMDSEGNMRPDYKIRWVQVWENGTKLTTGNDDLPF